MRPFCRNVSRMAGAQNQANYNGGKDRASQRV